MAFSIVIFFVWAVYALIMKKSLKEKFRLFDPLLSLVILSLIVSLSLGTNYVAAAVPSLNDGIGIHNFMAYWIIGEDNWSIGLFEKYFEYSLALSFFLLIVYSGLKLLKANGSSS